MRRALIIFPITTIVLISALSALRPPLFISSIGGWEPIRGRYEHLETTGLMDSITLSDGRSLIIRFTPDSDATAVAALDHIGKVMIFGTSDDKGMIGTTPFRQSIILQGEIAKVGNYGFIEGDDFHWFRLKGWTLELPFDIQIPNNQVSDVSPTIQSCSTLAEAGVKDLILDGRVIPLGQFLTRRP